MRRAFHTITAGCFLLGISFTGTITLAAEFKNLGQPCRPFNVLSGSMIKSPATGDDLLLLGNTNEVSGLELLQLDPATNDVKVVVAPAGQGAWAMQQIPGNRLVQGTYYDGKFLVFDLEKGSYIHTAQVPGEQYIWNTALGKDGKLYGGTYPNAVLASLDLDTYEVKSHKCPLPGVHQYLRYVNATTDGRIVCTYDMATSTALIFDPATDKFTSAPEGFSPLGLASTWEGMLCYMQDFYDGKTLAPVKELPFPPPPEKSWFVDYNLTTTNTLYLRGGNRIYRYKKGDAAPKLVAQWDARVPGAARGFLKDGSLVVSIGQDTFLVKPDTEAVELRPLPRPDFVYKSDGKTTTTPTGRSSHFLAADGKDRLWGGPLFGQTLYWIDLANGETTNTSIVSARGGEVYDLAFTDGKVYAVSYVGGEVIEYDPAKPFDLFFQKNPRTIAHSRDAYIRPNAGVVLGADGLLYSGWMAKYGTYGGAVYITDPKLEVSKNNRLIENPLGPFAISGIEVDDDFVYLGTTVAGNGLPNKPGAFGQLGIMDKKSGEIVWKQTLDGKLAADQFCLDPATGLLAFRVGESLGLFDTKARKVVELEKAVPVVDNIVGDGKGSLYFGSGEDLVVFDLKTKRETQRIKAPAKAMQVTRDPSTGKLYISGGPDVYEVTL